MKVLVVLCALLAAVVAVDPTIQQIKNDIEALDVNGNEFLDKLIDTLKTYMTANGLDPMALPDQWSNFTVIVVHVELGLFNGWLMDLTTIYRNGDALMNYKDQVIEVNADLGFEDVSITYDLEAIIGSIGPKGNAYILVKDLSLDINIVIDLTTMKAHLNALKIRHTGSIHVEINTDHQILNAIEDAIVNAVTGVFKNVIMSVAEKEIEKAINNILDNMTVG